MNGIFNDSWGEQNTGIDQFFLVSSVCRTLHSFAGFIMLTHFAMSNAYNSLRIPGKEYEACQKCVQLVLFARKKTI